MAIDEQLKQTVGKALGRIPSGVFILTATHDGQSQAMMASWVQQASFEPPTVSIALAKGRPIGSLIETGKLLALSILPENDTTLMKRYARGVKPGEDPFAGVETMTTPGGQVVLKPALAWLEGRVISACEFNGDHVLLIAELTGGAILQEGKAFTHQRGSGFHY